MPEQTTKPQPQGRWKKDWVPYKVSRAAPNRYDAEGDRDMSLLDSLAVRDAIERQANLAHLTEPERSTLSAILHETWRYGRLTATVSHSYLAVYANRGPRKMGEPLTSLRDKGFIDYSPGAPARSPEGHRQTHSKIRPLIPQGWEAFRDGGWRHAETDTTQPAELHPEPLGLRETKVSESEPSASRSPRGQGLGVREAKVSDSGAQSGRLNRGDQDGETRAGETNAPPLALRASETASEQLLRSPVLGSAWQPHDITRLLQASALPQAQVELTSHRLIEISDGIAQMRSADPTVTDAEAVYLVGLWAGDRRLRNADHLADHASRHRGEAAGLAELLAAEPAGTWLAWGYKHGTEVRRARVAARRRRRQMLS